MIDKSQAIKTMRASMLFKKHLIELDKKNFEKAKEYLLEINKTYDELANFEKKEKNYFANRTNGLTNICPK